MSDEEKSEEISGLVERLTIADAPEQQTIFEEAVETRESSELAFLLESLPLDERLVQWEQVPEADRIDVLVGMRAEARQTILDSIGDDAKERLFSDLDAESLIELADALPEDLFERVLRGMDESQRTHYQRAAQFGEAQIGRYVDYDLLIFPPASRCRDALRRVRRALPPYTDQIYLVNRRGRFIGSVPLPSLLATDPSATLATLAEPEPLVLDATVGLTDASERVEHSGLAAVPVTDDNGMLLGRITLRRALELTREQYESRLMATAGMDEDADLFAPVVRSSTRRATWLGINLLTAFLASWAIGLFEGVLQQVVALAILMPIVASMGGIAGSQTLTLIIRGLALGQIARGNLWPLLRKEMGVGVLNGVLWALVIGAIAGLWFQEIAIAMVIALAIVVNIVTAAFFGVVIPVLLQRWKIDPALSGSVILTTVTDVVGFVVFLGLGSLLLLSVEGV